MKQEIFKALHAIDKIIMGIADEHGLSRMCFITNSDTGKIGESTKGEFYDLICGVAMFCEQNPLFGQALKAYLDELYCTEGEVKYDA